MPARCRVASSTGVPAAGQSTRSRTGDVAGSAVNFQRDCIEILYDFVGRIDNHESESLVSLNTSYVQGILGTAG